MKEESSELPPRRSTSYATPSGVGLARQPVDLPNENGWRHHSRSVVLLLAHDVAYGRIAAIDRRHRAMLNTDDCPNQPCHVRSSAVEEWNITKSQDMPLRASTVVRLSIPKDVLNVLPAEVPLCHPLKCVKTERRVGIDTLSLSLEPRESA